MTDVERSSYVGGPSDINSLTWAKTKRAYEEGWIAFSVNHRAALEATISQVDKSLLRSLLRMAMSAALVAGLALAAVLAWWWLLVGAAFAVVFLDLSRRATVAAIRKAVFLDERLFHTLRDKRIIWFDGR